MDLIVLLSCLAIVISSTNSLNASNILLDAVMRRVFDKTLTVTREKTDPDLNALQFEHQHVDFCGPIICLNANITKGTIYGLLGFEPVKTEIITEGSQVTIDFDVKFPTLLLDSEYYEMEGNIMEAIPLAGKGKLLLEITGFRLWTKIVLNVCEDGTSIEEFVNPGFSIKNIYCRTEYDGNIDDIFNKMVEELLADYLNRFNKAIATYCGEIAKEILNPIL